ncbi:MAG: hypothetical protein M0R02_16740, partial [Bacteroidales bacterium]|nr:hypothetical protein [Bacteroidales bacterium]
TGISATCNELITEKLDAGNRWKFRPLPWPERYTMLREIDIGGGVWTGEAGGRAAMSTIGAGSRCGRPLAVA